MTAAEMTAAEIESLLREQGTGVLSLSDGSESYAVPMSFGYDGDSVYVQLVRGAESRKGAFVEATDIATLTVYTETPAASVVVRGPLVAVEDDDIELRATAAMAENAVVPTMTVDAETPTADPSYDYYRLDPVELTGRTFTSEFTGGVDD